MGAWRLDLRFGLRLLRRDPRFAVLVVLALALGIGATTAVFTVVDSILLRPLPYKDADRLVVALQGSTGSSPVSPADFFDYWRDARSFERLSVAQAWGATIGGGERPVRLDGLKVSGDLFGLLGVAPALGRTLGEADDQPGHEHVVVISDNLWRTQFGADRGVVGQKVPINGTPYVIVGVMPSGFRFAPFWVTRAELWTPIVLANRINDRDGQSLRMFGRLKDGVTVVQAQAEMSAICARLARDYPATNANLQITVTPLLDKVVAGIRPTLLLLMTLVVFVLLIACANVANALLARASGRQKEIALRIAMGAGRADIIRQLLTESLLLATLGALAGLLCAAWGVHALLATLPPGSLPRQQDVGFDVRVFAVASIATLLTGVVTGLTPALQLFRDNVTAVFQESSRGATEGRGRMRIRNLLIAGEVTLALVLLVGAGLLGRTMMQLTAVDPGFRVDHLAVATVSLDGTPYAEPDARQAMFDRVREHLQAVPFVSAVGAINHLPLAGDIWTLSYTIDGHPAPLTGHVPHAVYRVVQPGYFAAMGLSLVAGRDIATTDRASSVPVAVINQAMAQRQWGRENPIGQRFHLPGPGNVSDPITVVGVVANARQSDWTSPPDDEVYVAFAQRSQEFGLSAMTFVLRTSGDASVVAASIPREIALVDRGLVVSSNTTMASVVADELWRERLTSTLTGAFALVALGLAAIGIYAVVAFAVTRRTREFGVRMALGSTRGAVQRLAIADVLSPVCWGAGAGLLTTVACARLMRTLVYGVSVLDPYALGGAAGVLILAAIGAAWLPARRASRLDPTVALRQD
ncbi:MAG TPA: ABC transporter permease [Vicinamibacterales bacterium]|nr:ABC transporter permease [Vicinamibacterales bacterium]